MIFLHHVLWLGFQILGIVLYCWPVTATLVLAAALAVVFQRHALTAAGTRRLMVLLLPFATPFLILAFGCAFTQEDMAVQGPAWRGGAVYLLVLAAFVQLVFVTVRARGFRWAALSVTLVLFWGSLCAAFIVAMAVSGAWV